MDGVSATITAGATTNGSGSSTVTFNVPAVPNGAQSVVVTDASSNTATSATDFTVTASATGLAPTSGPVGTSATITAQGFAADIGPDRQGGRRRRHHHRRCDDGNQRVLDGDLHRAVGFHGGPERGRHRRLVEHGHLGHRLHGDPGDTSPDNLRIQLSSPGLISGVGGLYLITVTNLAATPTTGTLTITDVLPMA